MATKDLIAIAALFLAIGNTCWQIWVHRNKTKRENAQDRRQIERERLQDLAEKERSDKQSKADLIAQFHQTFLDHRGLETWKAKAYEAQDAGLSVEEVVSILERVWVPYHKDPVSTQQQVLDPMMHELKGRVAKGYAKK